MGKRVSFKKLIAVVMAAAICFTAMPTEVEAAIKKASVTIEQGAGGEKDVTLGVGKKAQLRIVKDGQAYGKTAVTYKVTDGKSIVKVSKSGLITAKKAGDAEITIKDKSSDYTAVVYVEVTGKKAKKSNNKKYKITKIWLDRSTLTLELGEGYHFSCYAKGEDKNRGSVIWGCDNGDVVEVHDGGYIRAVGHGQARVTATKGGHTAACLVTVN